MSQLTLRKEVSARTGTCQPLKDCSFLLKGLGLVVDIDYRTQRDGVPSPLVRSFSFLALRGRVFHRQRDWDGLIAYKQHARAINGAASGVSESFQGILISASV